MAAASPDFGALYLRHRDAMHRVAAAVLRECGRASEANDVVHDAIASILASPPADEVLEWEAYLVTAAKRKALDRVRSAAARHSGPALDTKHHDQADPTIDIADDVASDIDRLRSAGIAWDSLAILDPRHRKVVWEVAALERPRVEVAAELGVSLGRVSQMLKRGLELLHQEVVRKGGAL